MLWILVVREMPSPNSGVGLQQMHGAASRVDPAAMPFPHRDEHYDFLILSQWADPTDSEENIRWKTYKSLLAVRARWALN